MSSQYRLPPQVEHTAELVEGLAFVFVEMAKWGYRAFLSTGRHRRGCRLRSGRHTPLWNEVVRQIRPHLRRYGDQVKLGRLLGLPRQQIHAYFIRRSRMPDAERTLQFIVWLTTVREGWQGPEWASRMGSSIREPAAGKRQPPVDMSGHDSKDPLDTGLL